MEGRQWASSGSICDLHPEDEAFSGSFCPSCLRDRLAGLDASSVSVSVSVSGRRSTSSLFCQHANANAHLRRCKSFSHNSNSNSNRRIDSTHPPEQEQAHVKMKKLHPSSHSNFFLRKWHQYWRRKHPQSHLSSSVFVSSTPQPQHQHLPQSQPHRFSFDQPQFRPHLPSSDACSSASSRRPLLHLPPAPAPALPQPQPPLQHHDDIPGSQAHTRDYYLHSSTSRRRTRLGQSLSFDRRTTTPPPQLPLQTPNFNSKVSPTAPPAQFFHCHHPHISNPNPNPNFHSHPPHPRHPPSKQKWNLRGLFQRSKGTATANHDQSASFNANYTRSHSYSYNQPDHLPPHLLRCNSHCSLTARSSFTSTINYTNAIAAQSIRRNSVDNNIFDFNVHPHPEKTRDAFVFRRNQSARFSSARLDDIHSKLHF